MYGLMGDIGGFLGKLVAFISGGVGLLAFIYVFRKQDASDAKKYYANLFKAILVGGMIFIISMPIIAYIGWKLLRA